METHVTVLRNEAIEALGITPKSKVVDVTLGAGGHAAHIIQKLGKEGVFVGIDADSEAIRQCTTRLKSEAHISLCVGNFKDIDSILDAQKIDFVDAILADLGWRMEQFSGNGKGFSFQVDEPLLMTYGDPEGYACTARDIVNDWDEHDIANVLTGYGEERYARSIARGIVKKRSQQPILSTFQLVDTIRGSVPTFYLHGKINPATRTFQALRIAVNDELQVLETFIAKALQRLTPHGRLAIISFHSLEDRIVKHTFRTYEQQGGGTVLTKKPITAGESERLENPRSRSAKLRIFKKL